MFTIIGADGKEYGPASASQIRAWIEGGRANLETKARRGDETEWKTLGAFPEFSGVAAAQPAVAPPPAAAATPAVTVDPAALIARAAPLDIGSCLQRGWATGKANFFPILGTTLLVGLAAGLAGAIPLLGILCSLFLTGVFYGGLYYYILKKARGEPAELSDAFSGFSVCFLQLALATLVSTLLLFAGLLLLILPGIYLGVCWAFTYLIVREKGLEFWPAMELGRQVITAQWFRVFGLFLSITAIVMLLACVPVGLLIAASLASQTGNPVNIALFGLGMFGIFFVALAACPFLLSTLVHAYDDLFNPPDAG